MADLTYIEKATIEKFLGMKSGCVMDFSDETIENKIQKTNNRNKQTGLTCHFNDNDTQAYHLTNEKGRTGI